MKGLVLAGGMGTRLYPTTKVVNKHLLLVYDKPMVMYPIETLREAGISDIILTLSAHAPEQMMELLGDGSELGVNLSYVIHGEAKGIAYAINHSRHLLQGEPFICLLGDNIFGSSIKPYVDKFKSNPDKSIVLFKRMTCETVKGYGVPELEGVSRTRILSMHQLIGKEKPKLIQLIEKPEVPPSPYAVLGAYFLTPQFFDVYQNLKPSIRGEYEITDAINALLPNVDYVIYESDWYDCGIFDSILEASNYIRKKKED